MTSSKIKRRRRQKYRVLMAQEYIAGLHPLEFAALMTVIDELDDYDPATVLVPWGDEPPREPIEPTTWEKIKDFFDWRADAESN